MERSKKTFYGLAVAALILCAAIFAAVSAINAFAWYDWDKHDAPIISADDLADANAYDANGYRTTIKDGAWGYGVKAHSYDETTQTTTVTVTGNSALINRTELDMSGGKAVKLTYKSAGSGLWLTLATQAMFESGHRLNPSGNEGKGMPVSIRLDEGAVYHTEYNGFGDKGSGKTEISGMDTDASHDLYIYAGTGGEEDFSFATIDGKIFKIPALDINTFKVEDGGETYYPAYMYFYASTDAQVFELGRPEVVDKPEVYMIDMASEVRLDVDGSTTLEPRANTKLATDYPDTQFKWSSSDEAVATVDAHGVITAVSSGKADIKCYVTDTENANEEVASKTSKLTVCGYDEGGWLINGNPTVWGGIGNIARFAQLLFRYKDFHVYDGREQYDLEQDRA